MANFYQIERFSQIRADELAQEKERIRLAKAASKNLEGNKALTLYAAIMNALGVALVKAGSSLQHRCSLLHKKHEASAAAVRSATAVAE